MGPLGYALVVAPRRVEKPSVRIYYNQRTQYHTVSYLTDEWGCYGDRSIRTRLDHRSDPRASAHPRVDILRPGDGLERGLLAVRRH